MRKVYVSPFYTGPDKGDGGIRRVTEAMAQHLPKSGWTISNDPNEQVDAANLHASNLINSVVAQDLPIVASCHGLYWTGFGWPKAFEKVNTAVIEVCRVAEEITAPSEWVANSLRRNLHRPVRAIHHGIEIDDWPVGDPNAAVTLRGAKRQLKLPTNYVLWNKARVDDISDPVVLDQLAARLPNVQFVTTFGEEKPNVTITGRVSYDVMKQIVLGAGAYLCSARETFGIGTIEAMAAGVPVVGWSWGGQREILNDGGGLLSKPDDYEDLAAKTVQVLGDRADHSARARQVVVERFLWEDKIPDYAAALDAAVGRPWRAADAPTLSILMAVRDLEGYVGKAIRSVLQQGFQDWELIVADNRSSDRTLDAATEAAAGDERIRIIQNPIDLGLAGSRNRMLRLARGRYVLAFDGDDVLADDALARFVSAFLANRAVDIVYGDVDFVDGETGKPIKSGWPMPRFKLRDQMQGMNQIPQASAIRADVLRWMGGWRRRASVAEDADLWCRATSFGAAVGRVDGVWGPSRPPVVEIHTHNRPGSKGLDEPRVAWQDWFPWGRDPKLTPYGAFANLREREGNTACEIHHHEDPKVAVVIPVGPGHHEHALTACDSVMAQTIREWECIAVNDTGGPLNLPPWVKQIEPPPGQRFGGTAAARNAGIDAIRAGATVFLDADDYLVPSALEELLRAIPRIESGEPGFIYPDFYADKGEETIEPQELDDWSPDRLIRSSVHGVTALYPTRRLREVGGFDAELPAWEDWDLAFKLADIGLCAYHLQRPLFVYRLYEGRRREENYENREAGKEAFRAKWRKYIDQGEPMACRKCPGRVPSAPAGPPMAGISTPPPGSAEMAYVTYTGTITGPMTIDGPATRTRYRFGTSKHFQQSWVHVADLEKFKDKPDFTIQAHRPEAAILGTDVQLRPEAPALDPELKTSAARVPPITKSPLGPDELLEMTNSELIAHAMELGITGTSKMKKVELVEHLQGLVFA